MTAGRRVVIGVCTFRRPEGLARLLRGIVAEIEAQSPLRGEVDVIVVDNDPEGTEVPSFPLSPRCRFHFRREPRRGIPFARNRVVDTFLELNGDFLVFVDDDGTPQPGWLASLVATAERNPGAIVQGGNDYELPPETPSWIARTRFFVRLLPPNGTEVPTAATHNVLIPAAVFREVRFENRWGLQGGTDTLFSLLARRRGFRIVACPESRMIEFVQPERATWVWMAGRSFRHGLTWSQAHLEMQKGLGKRAGFVVRGILRCARCVAIAAVGYRKEIVARRLLAAASGVGTVMGALGFTVESYR